MVFSQLISSWDATEYTLHGLNPATAYEVQIEMNFQKKNHRTGNYEMTIPRIKMDEEGDLTPLKSNRKLFLTS